VRQYLTYVQNLTVVVNGGDQPELISRNVEDGQIRNLVSTWKSHSQVRKSRKIGSDNNTVPVFQRSSRLRVLLHEVQDFLLADNPHVEYYLIMR